MAKVRYTRLECDVRQCSSATEVEHYRLDVPSRGLVGLDLCQDHGEPLRELLRLTSKATPRRRGIEVAEIASVPLATSAGARRTRKAT